MVGKYVKYIVYYSEIEDFFILIENIGVFNIERGKVSYWIEFVEKFFKRGNFWILIFGGMF